MRKFMSSTTPLLLVLAVLSGCGGSSSNKANTPTSSQPSTGSPATATVKTASNASLGGTVLVDSAGMTLYSLSAEHGGKFICTSSACESLWHPLVAAGGSPSGAESLGTVKRPNGEEQVTYKGMPLYTFAQDSKPGDAKGQGFKDVGTWSAVMTSTSSGGAAQSPTGTTTSSGSGGYRY
jgi:predicted lipoprotein with Yx(FWY)xxD motif